MTDASATARPDSADVEPLHIAVTRAGQGIRADRFLAEALTERLGAEHAPSRAELQRWMDAGFVTRAGVKVDASAKLREGADLVILLQRPRLTSAVAEGGIVFDVLYTDDDLVVIDKPAGLVVHPARGNETGTLVNGLLARGLFREDVITSDSDGDAHLRPGIVHRLDKDTSGVMVVARTAFAREALQKMFAAHDLTREYWAFAEGIVTEGMYSTLHGRHPTDRIRFSGRVREGKRAITKVKPLEVFGVASLVACRLETGRTHQIRVHLSEDGHPILGDALYGRASRDPRLQRAVKGLTRQALHAHLLGFVHPKSAKYMQFESAMPADLQTLHTALRALEKTR